MIQKRKKNGAINMVVCGMMKLNFLNNMKCDITKLVYGIPNFKSTLIFYCNNQHVLCFFDQKK